MKIHRTPDLEELYKVLQYAERFKKVDVYPNSVEGIQALETIADSAFLTRPFKLMLSQRAWAEFLDTEAKEYIVEQMDAGLLIVDIRTDQQDKTIILKEPMMKYLIIFEQRSEGIKIFIKDDFTREQEKELEACNGYLQNNGAPEDLEATLDDICGEVFEGAWDDSLVYDSETDEGEASYEINAPAIGLKIIHIGSV